MGYWNEIDPKETRKIIQNERDTFHSRAQADAELEAQGRFKRQNETRITGTGALPSFPAIPSGPWSAPDPVLPDPATNEFGVAIDEMEPTGSPQEIERSLERRDAVPNNCGTRTASRAERRTAAGNIKQEAR
jgi:hypothetical protein